jgi:porin
MANRGVIKGRWDCQWAANRTSLRLRVIRRGKIVKKYSFIAIIALSALINPVHAQQSWRASLYDDPLLDRSALTGNWDGARDELAARGITLTPSVTQFYQGPTAGNTPHIFYYGGKAETFLDIDADKLGLLEGFSIHVHGEYNFGETPFPVGGTTLPNNTAMTFPVANMDGGDLTSVYFTQRFGSDVSLSAGKINMFDAYAAAAKFSGGRGIEKFWNVAFVGPPTGTVPVSAFGAIGTFKVADPVTLTLMVYDPRDALNRTGFEDPFKDGVTGRGSVDFRSNLFGLGRRDSVTVAISNERATDLSAVGDGLRNVLGTVSFLQAIGIRDELIKALIARSISGGFLSPFPLPEKGEWYHAAYSFEQTLWQSQSDPSNAWGLFGQIGVSDGNPNSYKWEGLIGIGGTSPIPGRSNDKFGAGFYYYGYTDFLKPPQGLYPLLKIGDEYGGEIFYNFAVTKWLRLTADFQVIAPAIKAEAVAPPLTNPVFENNSPVVLVGLRGQVLF